ncbi:phage terminase small subunit [Clostridium sp. HV4-5-A1G]|uniref:phage terminase small subunit n=1 Tax=Clostridium sp. HV4-5-A1G TaxID=2004595 RepID=UPI00123BDE37|nr:phage terminase small subunit [Clostridium sp. HV4-5-A1G]KAA8676187.1 terminase [Clostridium sp. HV4-5-A1G]
MPRQRSPNRDKAFEIYKENHGNIDLVKIAEMLSLSPGTIRGWKNKDKWDSKLNGTLQKDMERSKRKKGAQPKNKNSKGHVSSVPKGNKNAETHGFFSKIFPPETIDIVEDIMVKNPLDMLWENIIIQYTAIARSQRIMDVTEKSEMIKELKKSKVKTKDRSTEKTSTNESEKEYEYEFQFAWDRQATFLQAQSRAMSELRSLIKQYDEMLHNNWDKATEEQKLRIEKLRCEVDKVKNHDKDKPIEIMIKRKSDE